MKKKLCITGIVLGVLLTVIGLKFALTGKINYDGEIPSDYSFGADYYTEQYATTRDTAIDIVKVGNCIEKEFHMMFQLSGFTVAIMGLIVSCYFGMQFSDIKEKEQAAAAAVPTEKTVQTTETFVETQEVTRSSEVKEETVKPDQPKEEQEEVKKEEEV